MSVVAAAVGPAGVAAYGAGPQLQQCGGSSGARKRKDVVFLDQEEAADESRRPGDEFLIDTERRAEPHRRHGLFVLERVEEEEEEEEQERSSIGAASTEEDRGGEEAGEEAHSGTMMRRRSTRTKHRQEDSLACMDALDDALPIKRGLSNFFSGKSRSFANLQDAAVTSSARDLAKPENPFNKRRRVLRCCSIRRVASTSLTALPPFFLPPAAAGDDDGNKDGDGSG